MVTFAIKTNYIVTMPKSTHFIGQPLYAQIIQLINKNEVRLIPIVSLSFILVPLAQVSREGSFGKGHATTADRLEAPQALLCKWLLGEAPS